jgi:hypothetical protein
VHIIPRTSPANPTNAPVFEWLRALRGCGLPPAVVGVLAFLASYADPDGRNAFPGEERLAADAGVTPRTVRRHLETARAAGWIARDETRNRGRGLADRYRLTVPAAVVEAALEAVDSPQSTGQRRPVDNRPAPDSGAHSTGQRATGSPDSGDRPPIQVPTQGPTPRARAGAAALVVEVLERQTGKVIDLEHAHRVVRHVLDGRPVANRLAYLRAALEREPLRYLPTPVPPAFRRVDAAAGGAR